MAGWLARYSARSRLAICGALAALCLCAIDLAALACPFCPPSSPPLAERVSAAQVVVLVKWLHSSDQSPATAEPQVPVESQVPAEPLAPVDPAAEPVAALPPEEAELTGLADASEADDSEEGGFVAVTSTFEVIEVVRSTGLTLHVTSQVTVPYLQQGQPGDLFIMLGQVEAGEPSWSDVLEVSEISYQYIRQAPSPEQPAAVRLAYFLKFLEYPDPLMANDAFAEFSRASYADVASLAAILPRDKLRRWLGAAGSPEQQVRSGFYGMLLGLCGDETDARLLEAKIVQCPTSSDVRLGLDGWMGGFLLLRGSAALETLVAAKLDTPGIPAGEVHALLNALRFMAEYAPERVPRDQLLTAARRLLQVPEVAELVIVDLARWNDWNALPLLVNHFGQEPFDTPSARRVIVRFAQTCLAQAESTAAPNKPIPSAEQRALAQQILDRSTPADRPTLRSRSTTPVLETAP